VELANELFEYLNKQAFPFIGCNTYSNCRVAVIVIAISLWFDISLHAVYFLRQKKLPLPRLLHLAKLQPLARVAWEQQGQL
jgi:hypothetical protein